MVRLPVNEGRSNGENDDDRAQHHRENSVSWQSYGERRKTIENTKHENRVEVRFPINVRMFMNNIKSSDNIISFETP